MIFLGCSYVWILSSDLKNSEGSADKENKWCWIFSVLVTVNDGDNVKVVVHDKISKYYLKTMEINHANIDRYEVPQMRNLRERRLTKEPPCLFKHNVPVSITNY